VKQHPRRGVEPVGGVKDELILKAVVLGEEVPPALLRRGGVFLVVPQVGEPFADRVPPGDGAQVCLGDFVLGGDPGGDLGGGADVVFEPAVRVGDCGAVVVVGVVDALGGRILE